MQQTVPIVILGTDAVLAASPATPVQLAHACLRAGFANVIPASWGDELIAAAVLRRLPQFGNGPVIQCSCPIVAHRLLTVGADLRPVLLPLVPPPVAVARYVRTMAQPVRTRITYVGACPGALDEAIAIRMTPDALIAMLAERDIVLDDQPRVFESIIPPDRRRFRSQPGGVPSPEALWNEVGARTLVEIGGDDFVAEIAQHLLTGKNVFIDASTRLGCACSGAIGGAPRSRADVVAIEPPRATAPIVDETAPIQLDLPVPAAPRTPVDVVAVPTTPTSTHMVTPAGGIEVIGSKVGSARANTPVNEPRPPRLSTPITPRAVLSAFPVARDVEGKSLPRAYVARRRSSPKGLLITLPPEDSPLIVSPHAPATEALERVESPAPQAAPPIATRAEELASPPTVTMSVHAQVLLPETAVASPPEPVLVVHSPLGVTAPVTRAEPIAAPPPPTSPRAASYDGGASPNAPGASRATAPRRGTVERKPAPTQATWTMSRWQLVLVIIAIAMITITASTVVAIIVGRSVRASVSAPVGR